jgi:hypothetical protein
VSDPFAVWEMVPTIYGEVWPDLQPEQALLRGAADRRAREILCELRARFTGFVDACVVCIEPVQLEPPRGDPA